MKWSRERKIRGYEITSCFGGSCVEACDERAVELDEKNKRPMIPSVSNAQNASAFVPPAQWPKNKKATGLCWEEDWGATRDWPWRWLESIPMTRYWKY